MGTKEQTTTTGAATLSKTAVVTKITSGGDGDSSDHNNIESVANKSTATLPKTLPSQQQHQQQQHVYHHHHSKAQVIIIPATPASTVATNAAKKIRRAFSMPRNPFQWSRKFKTSAGGDTTGSGSNNGGHQHHHSALSACVGNARRNGSVVSLNSYTAVCKDTNGVVQDNKNNEEEQEQQHQRQQDDDVEVVLNKQKTAGGGNRVFRRSSLRKFINRIAQHVSTSVNIGSTDKSSFVGIIPFYTGCWRRKEANKHGSQANSLSSTDRVPPISGYQWPPDQTPGVTGLKNHGNTCFMNAVLQCLSHTDILAEYFVLDQYKADLKRRNKINSRKFGTKGELTEQLANVLKALWTCKNESDHSTSFKAVVDRYGSQFRSSTQHDAQEFLFWLLDKVHEDLNTATKRRYKSVKNSYGRPDEIIAAETLANHIRCNNSFVQAVFQAQFRSSLTCPRCKKQSNTFDPFHCISVQLPQLTQQTIFVTVLYLRQHPRQVKLGLTVPAGSPIVALREQLHTDTGIAAERMVLADINETGFTRVYYDTQPVSTLAGVETIYCIEVPAEQSEELEAAKAIVKEPVTVAATQATNNSNDKEQSTGNNAATPTSTITNTTATKSNAPGGSELLLLIANVKKKKKIEVSNTDDTADTAPIVVADEEAIAAADAAVEGFERFGAPFCLRAPRDCSYTELQKLLLRAMAPLLKPEVFAYATPLSQMFQIRLQDPSADPDTYLEQVAHPLLTEMIDLALSVLSAEAGPAHIKLLLEWPDAEAHFADLTDVRVEHASVARLQAQKANDTAALTLEQCLEHYTKAETLSAEDAWRCPHCQQYLPVVKTLGLWSLPDILVVHFKRFRQHQSKGANAAKLTTMVKFPLSSFDMAPHLAKEHVADVAAHSRSPWRKLRPDSRSSTLQSCRESPPLETRYDLYAVCYHQGDTLETGHYTAACKNPYDHQWYKFDDQRVAPVPSDSMEEEIINNEAYMLFYQRRHADAAECCGSSSTSGEHWVAKLAPPQLVTEKPAAAVVATTAVAVTVADEEKHKETDEKEEKNNEAAPLESVPEKAQTKPLEIPKLDGEVSVLNAAKTAAAIAEAGAQPVKLESTNESINVDIEGLEFADDGVDEETDEAPIKLQIPETLTTPTPQHQQQQQIFEMEDDLETKNSNLSAKVQTLGMATATLKSPIKHTSANATEMTTSIIATPQPLLNGKSSTLITTNGTATTKSNASSAKSSAASSSAGSTSSSASSLSSPHSLAASTNGATTLQTKFNAFSASSASANCKEPLLSSSLKSNSSCIIAATPTAAHSAFSTSSNDFQLNRQQHLFQHHQPQPWLGSRSSVSALESSSSSAASALPHQTHCLNLRHSFSTSSNYKLKECSDTLSSMLRNSANTCSKDTLLFIDQQNHHHHHHHHHHNHHSLMEDDDDTFMGSRSLWISPVTPHKLITVSPKN